MSRKRRVFGAAFKAKVALVAARGDRTTAQLASEFSVHTSQVTSWKKHLLAEAAGLFEDGRGRRDRSTGPVATRGLRRRGACQPGACTGSEGDRLDGERSRTVGPPAIHRCGRHLYRPHWRARGACAVTALVYCHHQSIPGGISFSCVLFFFS